MGKSDCDTKESKNSLATKRRRRLKRVGADFRKEICPFSFWVGLLGKDGSLGSLENLGSFGGRAEGRAERELMEELDRTYGKPWRTWDTQRDSLPLSIPHPMMGFMADGQVKPDLVQERDARMRVSAKNRQSRGDIASPPILPGADR